MIIEILIDILKNENIIIIEIKRRQRSK